jgi:iron complex outermembrane receptor protein
MMNREFFMKDSIVYLVLFTAFVVSQAAAAESNANNEPENGYFDMSIDQLAQELEVVSASRTSHSVSKTSVPVSVITADDIHYSGLTHIPDILRFFLGVDVIQNSRNLYAVGVRGQHEVTSDRTLVLVNGRVCNSPGLGGMEWESLPVLVEDIEQIEIVRGPGGAAWGANALTGVINIITKRPQDVPGVFVSTTASEYGDTFTHVRYGYTQDPWSFRISTGYLDQKTSDAAGAGRYISDSPLTALPGMGYSSYKARDFAHNYYTDSELQYRLSDDTKWSFGAASANLVMGDFEMAGYYPKDNITRNRYRFFSRLDHTFDDDLSGYLQWFGEFDSYHMKVMTDYVDSRSNDIEYQLTWQANEKHEVLFGGNVRWFELEIEAEGPQSARLTDMTPSEQWHGLFFMDRYQATDRLILESQFRYDWYTGTQEDWSARETALYALDDNQNHILRLSTAKAYRAPCVSLREVYISRIPNPYVPGTYLTHLNSTGDDMDNEETWIVEAGYNGKLDKDLNIRLDTYYQDFSKLTGSVSTASGYTLKNIDGAKGYGAEIEITKQIDRGQISSWYSYHGFNTDASDQSIRAYPPSKHKAGLRFRYYLSKDWTLNTNYVYNDYLQDLTSAHDISTYHRLDLTLSRKFAKEKGEFMIGVRDLFNDTYGPTYAQASLTAHEIPGRTIFVRLQYQF